MTTDDSSTRTAYRLAAGTFADLVARIPADRLDGPGVGDWTLRDLLGHTVVSALISVPAAVDQRPTSVLFDSPETYYAAARSVPEELRAASAAHYDRLARDTGASLGDDPGAATREHLDRALAALAGAGDDDLVTTPARGMRLGSWLPVLTHELVVHGSDVALAAGLPVTFDPAAVSAAVTVAARTAVQVGDGMTVLRALTGRTTLPAGFTVVQ